MSHTYEHALTQLRATLRHYRDLLARGVYSTNEGDEQMAPEDFAAARAQVADLERRLQELEAGGADAYAPETRRRADWQRRAPTPIATVPGPTEPSVGNTSGPSGRLSVTLPSNKLPMMGGEAGGSIIARPGGIPNAVGTNNTGTTIPTTPPSTNPSASTNALISFIQANLGAAFGDPNFNPSFDLNSDNVIDARDFSLALAGQTVPTPNPPRSGGPSTPALAPGDPMPTIPPGTPNIPPPPPDLPPPPPQEPGDPTGQNPPPTPSTTTVPPPTQSGPTPGAVWNPELRSGSAQDIMGQGIQGLSGLAPEDMDRLFPFFTSEAGEADPGFASRNALSGFGFDISAGNPFVQFMESILPGAAQRLQYQNVLGGVTDPLSNQTLMGTLGTGIRYNRDPTFNQRLLDLQRAYRADSSFGTAEQRALAERSLDPATAWMLYNMNRGGDPAFMSQSVQDRVFQRQYDQYRNQAGGQAGAGAPSYLEFIMGLGR